MTTLRDVGRWIDRKRRARATAEVLSRLDRRLMDDLGICPATVAEIANAAALGATDFASSPVEGSRGTRS
ncbi:MAG: hypothetical protein KJS97_12910 [Alphaproteobacteria bacterium]|nr:hypothetical protein [Alphaproteobacteria bacterium]